MGPRQSPVCGPSTRQEVSTRPQRLGLRRQIDCDRAGTGARHRRSCGRQRWDAPSAAPRGAIRQVGVVSREADPPRTWISPWQAKNAFARGRGTAPAKADRRREAAHPRTRGAGMLEPRACPQRSGPPETGRPADELLRHWRRPRLEHHAGTHCTRRDRARQRSRHRRRPPQVSVGRYVTRLTRGGVSDA